MNRISVGAKENKLRRTAQESMSHFSCPDGYLDGLASDIMGRIPMEEVATAPSQKSWWVRLRPSLYLAASFLTLILSFQGVKFVREHHTSLAMQPTEVRDDDYASYYEDYSLRLVDNEEERQLDRVLCL